MDPDDPGTWIFGGPSDYLIWSDVGEFVTTTTVMPFGPFGGHEKGFVTKKVHQPQPTLCPDDKQRFFNWLSDPLDKMAKDLGINRDFLFALAAKEGGWTQKDLNHNMPLNNPFGVNFIANREAAGNKSYKSIEDATKDWISLFGDRVRGAKTIDEFINGLQNPGDGKQPYNTVTDDWAAVLKGLYTNSVPRYKGRCDVK